MFICFKDPVNEEFYLNLSKIESFWVKTAHPHLGCILAISGGERYVLSKESTEKFLALFKSGLPTQGFFEGCKDNKVRKAKRK